VNRPRLRWRLDLVFAPGAGGGRVRAALRAGRRRHRHRNGHPHRHRDSPAARTGRAQRTPPAALRPVAPRRVDPAGPLASPLESVLSWRSAVPAAPSRRRRRPLTAAGPAPRAGPPRSSPSAVAPLHDRPLERTCGVVPQGLLVLRRM